MRKKVLVYNKSVFPVSQTFVYQQVKVAQNEFDVSVMGHYKKDLEYFSLEGLRISSIDEEESFFVRLITRIKNKLGLRDKSGIKQAATIRKILLREKPDLIHAHFGFNAVNILSIARELDIPLVVTFHGYDASPKINSRINYLKALPALFQYASTLIVVSKHMIDILPLSEEQKKKIVVYPCAVDSNLFSPAPAKKSGTEIRILHSGRLVPKKGVDDLVDVFEELYKKHPECRLDIVGGGPLLSKIQQLIADKKLGEAITTHGSQSHQAVKKFLGDCDIFVLNSRTAEDGDMEGSPVSILEAMSMEKAVISTRHAGIPEIIDNNQNGLLIAEKDNSGLLEALLKLVENYEFRSQLANNARASIQSKFSLDATEQELLDIYRKAMK